MKRILRVAVVAALLFAAGGSSSLPSGAQAADATELRERAKVYREHIANQMRNIQLMKQELATNPDHPNTARLGSFFATAAGVRTEAYKSAPPYIQTLIDRLEADKALAAMNLVTMSKYPHNVAYGHFMVEIERSQKFIAMLRKQLKDTEQKLATETTATTVNISKLAPFLGNWKCVGGPYEIEIEGEDGSVRGIVRASSEPDKALPYDYTVGSTMFEGGRLQQDGSLKAQWAQYSWVNSNTNHRLKRGLTTATLKLRPNNQTSMEVRGNSRKFGGSGDKIHWLNEFGSEFRYSFVKTE